MKTIVKGTKCRIFHILLILLIGGIGVQTIISCSSDSSGEEEGGSSSSVVGGSSSSGGGGTSSSSGGGSGQNADWLAEQIAEAFDGLTLPEMPGATSYEFEIIETDGEYKTALVRSFGLTSIPTAFISAVRNEGFASIANEYYDKGLGNGDVIELKIGGYFPNIQSKPNSVVYTIQIKADDFTNHYTLPENLELVYEVLGMGILQNTITIIKVGNDYYSKHEPVAAYNPGRNDVEFFLSYDATQHKWTEFVKIDGGTWELTGRTATSKGQVARFERNTTNSPVNYESHNIAVGPYYGSLTENTINMDYFTADGQADVAGQTCDKFVSDLMGDTYRDVSTRLILKSVGLYEVITPINTTVFETTGVTLPAGLP